MINKSLIGPLALAFCFIITLPAYAQDAITPEKKALMKEFMKLLNTSTDSEAVIDQFLEQGLKQSAPLISKALLTEIPQDKLSTDEVRRLKSEAD